MVVDLKHSEVCGEIRCLRQIKSYVNNMLKHHILNYS